MGRGDRAAPSPVRGEALDPLSGAPRDPVHASPSDPSGVGLLAPVNCSEGRDLRVIERLADAARPWVLDVHRDTDHHRCVVTIGGPGPSVEAAVRRLALVAVDGIDLGHHQGVHPRLGALDVVPFVPLVDGAPARHGADLGDALAARDRFARWAADTLALPCFLYGPERTLPTVRRDAFGALRPDTGPPHPHPTAGACAVGARSALVAYNIWVTGTTLATARQIAASVRGPCVRALALPVTGAIQISCNLIDPDTVGPVAVTEAVVDALHPTNGRVVRTEVVGLVPRRLLDTIPPDQWARYDLDPERTVEARWRRVADAVRPSTPARGPESPGGVLGTDTIL